MTFEETMKQQFFVMYQMDYQFGIYNKDQMKDLVVKTWLSPENYKKIVGEDYVAPAKPAQPTTPQA